MQRTTKSLRVFLHTVKRIFRSRNVIIISDHKVEHVPLSGVMQVLIIVSFLGFFSGVSYITGSYMAARSVIMEKDRKIANASVEKSAIRDELNTLKIDLARLSQNGSELNSYSKFLVNQHSDGNDDLFLPALPLVDSNMFGQNTGKLLDRISFLENRINEIKDENDHLVMVIRERTDRKIDYLNDVISMTGLDPSRLEYLASSENKEGKKLSVKVSPVVPVDDASAKKNTAINDNEGGPYIPYDKTWFTDSEQSLITDVDRLVALNEAVRALPLNTPINDAHQSSPFGKRLDPMNHRWSMHPGLDLSGPTGARVFAANNGVVMKAGRKPAYGNMVDIQHKFGIVTRYAHLSKILVKEGDKVNKGQLIGIQGSTGRSTGPHLHYEVRINDRPVNPLNFINAGEYVSQE